MDEATDITLPEQLTRHDFGSVAFASGADALFERHLRFDGAIEPAAAYERQRFEALVRSVRDILSRRRIKTLRTYDQKNPKRVYSSFFFSGDSLSWLAIRPSSANELVFIFRFRLLR